MLKTSKHRTPYISFRHILYTCVLIIPYLETYILRPVLFTWSTFVVYTLIWAKGLGWSRHGIVRRLAPSIFYFGMLFDSNFAVRL